MKIGDTVTLAQLPEQEGIVLSIRGKQVDAQFPSGIYSKPLDFFKEKDKVTSEERNRRLSKYVTDFEKHKAVLAAPFDVSKNPEVLSQFEEQAATWVLQIGCSADVRERVVKELANAGLEAAEDYVNTFGDGSHGEKYDLFIPDPNISDVDLKLGIYLGPWKLVSTNRYQIGRKEFIFRNLLKVRVLEAGENLSDFI